MLITIAGIRIYFRNRQLYCFLRTGMYTGQARLTIPRKMHRFSICYMNGRRRAYLFTGPATHTAFCYPEKMLPGICRHLDVKMI